MPSTTFTEQVGALRRTLRRAIVRRVGAASARPIAQLQALQLIRRDEVRTQAELAQRLLIDAPAASRLVERLEADGLLKRMPGSDRRCVRLRVTPAARGEIAVFEEAMRWLNLQVRQHLSQREVDAGLSLMNKLQQGLDDLPG